MCVHIENPHFSIAYCVLRKGRRDGQVTVAFSVRKVSVSNGIRIRDGICWTPGAWIDVEGRRSAAGMIVLSFDLFLMTGQVVCAVQTGGRRSETFAGNRCSGGRKERDLLFWQAGALGWELTKHLVKMSALSALPPPPFDYYTKNSVVYTKSTVMRGRRLNVFFRLRRGCHVCRLSPPLQLYRCAFRLRTCFS